MPKKQMGLDKTENAPVPVAAEHTKGALEYKLTPAAGRPIRLILKEESRLALLNGQTLHLTAQEFSLLLVLARHCGQPVSRETLLAGAWGYTFPCSTRTVDVHIQRLRRKLAVPCIETVFRQGYLLKAQPVKRKP